MYLHGKVWVIVVVNDHIPNVLIQHGEQRSQRTQTSEVHHVIKVGSIVKTFRD